MKEPHRWVCSGWVEKGQQPRADEWECVKCGFTLLDGEITHWYCPEEVTA